MTYVTKAKVKGYLKAKGMNSSASVLESINTKVQELLDAAIERANANGRKTVQDRDL